MLKQILWTACVTPLNADSNQIDYKSLENCLRLQENNNNGILLLGSTGEGLSLTNNERQELLQFACNLKLNSQIIVGIPSHNLYAATEWLEFCKDLPIQGYLMTTPIYTKPGVIGQTKWFENLLNKVDRPAMLYNIPSRAGIRLHYETVKNLQQHHNFVSIKDSSGTVENIVEYQTAAPNIAVYCGDDYMMPALTAEGSVGLVSVVSNVWPAATRRYVEHCLTGGKIKSKVWWKACKALSVTSNPVPIKALMHATKIIAHDTVRLPLSSDDLPTHKTFLDHHKAMMNWKTEDEQ